MRLKVYIFVQTNKYNSIKNEIPTYFNSFNVTKMSYNNCNII